MKNNITLGVFTVKRFACYQGKYYTYGGFGDYIIDFSKYFSHVILMAHVEEKKPPNGYYLVDVANLEIVSLPVVHGEFQVPFKLNKYFKVAKQHIHRMDIVQARMPDYSGIVGAYLARKNNIPLFNLIIADWYREGVNMDWKKKAGLGLFLKIYYYVYDYLERKMCRNQIVLAQGDSCYDKHSKNAKECHLVLSSAHQLEDVIKKVYPKFELLPYTIINVGRLNGVKNQQLIIRAIELLNRKESNILWKFIHVGDGPKSTELKKLVKELGLEKQVYFKGRVVHGKPLWNLYDEADVFVLSSLSEGTPKVILEAMARGIAVIAPDIPGVMTSIKDKENGYIYPTGDLESLVDCLQTIAENPKKALLFGEKGLKIARQNTLEYRNKEMVSIIAKAFPQLNIK
jgi:glycosyltransferase involved in cell wall biosynthesis